MDCASAFRKKNTCLQALFGQHSTKGIRGIQPFLPFLIQAQLLFLVEFYSLRQLRLRGGI